MSEEKLYVVKNRSGEFWDFMDSSGFWSLGISDCPTTTSKGKAEKVAANHDGHVVTLIEEPEKEVLSKEQAKVIERAHGFYLPATFIANKSGNDEEEELLMNAYVNGYTVAKEKKYNVKVPGLFAKDVWYVKTTAAELSTTSPADKTVYGKFTESEIEHYGLQDCEKEEVTDDEV